MERRLAAILAADVVGYSRLMAADEKGTHARLKALRQGFIEPKVAEHHGRIVKLMGDGALVEFASVVDAVECAAAIREGVAERQADLAEDQRIAFRIGINIGDIIIEDSDIFGGGVNIAVRLEALAEPGGICVARNVYNQVKDKVDFGFQPMGEHAVKNIPEPVFAYRMLTGSASPARLLGFRRARGPIRLWVVAAATALILVAAGGAARWYWDRPAQEQVGTAAGALPLPDKPSIAVLPFDNLSGDPEQDYFSDGITEDLITDLSKISGLSVVARTAAFQYKGQAADLEDAARELGVRYVLEGSVRKAEERIRINAQLIDVANGYHLWAERYDRDLKDIFALQDEIVAQIVAALEVQLTEDESEILARRFTDNVEAYDLYLQGYDLYRRKSKETVYRARELFEQAIGHDADFAAAYARLSHTHLHAWHAGWEGPEALDRAVELAEKAVALNESSPEAHEQLGFMYLQRKQFDAAIREVERAIALDPDYAKGYARLGEVLAFAGRPEETAPLVERAMAMEPYVWAPWYQWILGLAYHGMGEYDRAIEALRRCLADDPKFYPAHVHLTAVYGELGKTDEARAGAGKVLEQDPKFSLEQFGARWPIKDQTFVNRLNEGLRKAGLPE
jgi:adenylate cyclase